MTDINKAIAFAKECLKWEDAFVRPDTLGPVVASRDGILSPNRTEDFQQALEQFLGKRFFIQISRGTSNLFKWTVIVGLQDRASVPSIHDHGRGDGDDMFDAVFDACVAAARLYPDAGTDRSEEQPTI